MRVAKAVVIALISIGYLTGEGHAEGRCLNLPQGAVTPSVVACETDDEYTFQLAGERHGYDKMAFRAKFAAAVNLWLESAGVEARADGATVEFWLSAPEINPAAAQGRVVVHLKSGVAFVAYLGLVPDEWKLVDKQVGLLGKGLDYPGTTGYAARSLLVKEAAGADATAVAGFMAQHGAANPEPFATGWVVFHTTLFEEKNVAEGVMADAMRATLVEKVNFNDVVEWIASKGLAFRFTL